MIKVTIYNEYMQERAGYEIFPFMEKWGLSEDLIQFMKTRADEIKMVHGVGGIHSTLKTIAEEREDVKVCHIAHLDMEEHGLTEAVLDDTDVLIWWSHLCQGDISDTVAMRVRDYVQRGMGVIFLHSAHMAKPMQFLLGTTNTLRWREGDFCRIWNTCPTHPIMKDIPEYIELEEEEMYGEFFDIPKPDDIVSMSWYKGGELFRSGCTWTRGYGRIFYFQPGHETNKSYQNPHVRQIIKNAIGWCAEPEIRKPSNLECIAIKEPMNNMGTVV